MSTLSIAERFALRRRGQREGIHSIAHLRRVVRELQREFVERGCDRKAVATIFLDFGFAPQALRKFTEQDLKLAREDLANAVLEVVEHVLCAHKDWGAEGFGEEATAILDEAVQKTRVEPTDETQRNQLRRKGGPGDHSYVPVAADHSGTPIALGKGGCACPKCGSGSCEELGMGSLNCRCTECGLRKPCQLQRRKVAADASSFEHFQTRVDELKGPSIHKGQAWVDWSAYPIFRDYGIAQISPMIHSVSAAWVEYGEGDEDEERPGKAQFSGKQVEVAYEHGGTGQPGLSVVRVEINGPTCTVVFYTGAV